MLFSEVPITSAKGYTAVSEISDSPTPVVPNKGSHHPVVLQVIFTTFNRKQKMIIATNAIMTNLQRVVVWSAWKPFSLHKTHIVGNVNTSICRTSTTRLNKLNSERCSIPRGDYANEPIEGVKRCHDAAWNHCHLYTTQLPTARTDTPRARP